MGKFSLGKLGVALSKIPKKRYVQAGIIGGAAAGGTAQGYFGGIPGNRKAAAAEGFKMGVLVGGATAFSPSIYRLGKRVVKMETKPFVNGVVGRGKVIFKRIRGRIVPIRVKT